MVGWVVACDTESPEFVLNSETERLMLWVWMAMAFSIDGFGLGIGIGMSSLESSDAIMSYDQELAGFIHMELLVAI